MSDSPHPTFVVPARERRSKCHVSGNPRQVPEAARAHEALEARQTAGKLLLIP
jgi:hypothetical protein